VALEKTLHPFLAGAVEDGATKQQGTAFLFSAATAAIETQRVQLPAAAVGLRLQLTVTALTVLLVVSL
jgi:hypothetical protein